MRTKWGQIDHWFILIWGTVGPMLHRTTKRRGALTLQQRDASAETTFFSIYAVNVVSDDVISIKYHGATANFPIASRAPVARRFFIEKLRAAAFRNSAAQMIELINSRRLALFPIELHAVRKHPSSLFVFSRARCVARVVCRGFLMHSYRTREDK